MTPRHLAAVWGLLVAALPAAAQTQYWNPALTGPTTWDTAAATWGATTTGPFTDAYANSGASVAVFGLTSGSATVTAASGLTADQVQFASNGFTLAGGPLALTGSATVSVAAGKTATVNTVLTGSAGLTKAGTGTLTLGGSNTFAGTVTVAAGTLALSAPAAFGGAANGLSVSAGAALDLGGSGLTVGAFNGAGTVRSTGAAAVTLTVGGGDAGGTFSGAVAATTGGGAVSLAKTGAGTVTLSGSNSFTGSVAVAGGTLVLSGSSNAFAGGIDVASGATLRLAGSSNSVLGSNTNNDTAVAAGGTFDVGGRSVTVGGLTGAGTVTSGTGGGTLTVGGGNKSGSFTGTLANSGALVLNVAKTGTGSQTFAGDNTFTGTLTAGGSGSLILQGANPTTAAVSVTGGVLLLEGSGSLAGASGFTINGGTLQLANTAAANSGARLRDAAGVTLSTGTLDFANSGPASFAEAVGAVTLNSTAATISTSQADVGFTSTLTLASLTRTAGNGFVNFAGAGLGTDARNAVAVTTAPTLANGLIGGWATVGGTDWATYSGGSVTAYAGYATDTLSTTWTATQNIKLTSGVNPLALLLDTQVNSLLLANTAGTSLDLGGKTLRVESGGLMALLAANATHTLGNGTLTAGVGANGAGELIVNTGASPSTGTVAVSATLANNGTGALRLTKYGAGTLELSGANTFTGLALVKVGTLRLASGTALGGTTSGTTVSSGATLDLNGQTVGTEPVSLAGTGVGGGGALVNSNAATPAVLAGPVTITSGTSVGGAGNTTLPAGFTASNVTLVKVGTGTVAVGTGWTGGGALTVSNGTLQLDAAAHAAGTLSLGSTTGNASGRVQVGSGTADAALTVTGLTTSGSGTANRIVSGTAGTLTLTVNPGSGSTNIYSGFLGGPNPNESNLALAKTGAGVLSLAAAHNPYTGGTTVTAGTLLATGQTGANSATGTGPVAVSGTGTLGGTGRVAGAVSVASGGSLAPGAVGATGTLTLGSGATLAPGSFFRVDAAATGTSDTLALGTGTLTFDTAGGSPTVRVSSLSGFDPSVAAAYTLATFTTGGGVQAGGAAVADGVEIGRYVEGTGSSGPVTLDASGMGLAAGSAFSLYRSGNALMLGLTPVPEPALGLALAAAALPAGRRLCGRRGPVAGC